MSMVARDTIFALSSGPPPAAIAIVRISGPAAGETLVAIANLLPPPRTARLVTLRDPADGLILDRAMILFFPGPRSATGEDLAELHLHGGRAVVRAVEAVLERAGLRRALPGEFTRRAFDTGRLDLAEVEGLGDLLTAETEGQRRNAIALAEGFLSRAIARWQTMLNDAAAAIEARIDFADEDDVPADDDGIASEAITKVLREIEAMLAAPPGERLRDGIRVAIGGPPNAGKSTLLNALVGREAAIAAATPGTTRDIIECPIQLGGLPFLFIDTAGLRDAEEEIERIGVDRAQRALQSADMILWLGEPEAYVLDRPVIRIHAQCDRVERQALLQGADIAVSAMQGQGMAALVALLVSRGTALLPAENEIALVERQRAALQESATILSDSISIRDILLIAESLRAARAALDRITGRGGIEPMLDALFGRFCIGK